MTRMAARCDHCRCLWPEADALSAEAVTDLPWIPSIHGVRGFVLLELGRLREAIPFLRFAVKEGNDWRSRAASASLLALAMSKNGDFSAARRFLRLAKKLDRYCPQISEVEQELIGTARYST